MTRTWWKRGVVLGAVIVMVASPAASRGSTFVMMSEAELAARSVAAVRGWVTEIESAEDPDTGGVNTYVHLVPERVIFGRVPDGELVLREVGGRVRGKSEWIFGSPEYRVGDEVLVFLSQRPDGTLHTTAMAMGKFDIVAGANGRHAAVRRLGEGVAIWDAGAGRLREAADRPEVYDLEDTLRLARRGAKDRPGGSRQTPIEAVPPELTQRRVREHHEAFTYLSTPSRWFEPDDGVPVGFAIDPTGDVGLGPVTSRAAMNDAFAAWTDVPTSGLVLADGGLMASPLSYAGCTGGNRIVFNDPFNEITNPSGCSGVLAIGGFCASSETRAVNGTTFRRIRVGKIMFNNGWSGCSGWNRCNVAEVATHELGHTLGFGHSTEFSATMFATAHFDGRCASLRSDDVAGASFVYPNVAGPSPTPTATPIPPTATRTPTATPVPPTATATPTPTPMPPTATRTPTAIAPTATPTRTSTPQPTATHTAPPPAHTATATASATATWTAPLPTATATRRGHRVRGRVQYYAGERAVPGAVVNLRGAMVDATQTTESGDYEFAAVPDGTWELAAEKASDFGTGISPLDAAYVLQAVAQLRDLDATQRLACDTTGDGQLSALDAARILQFSVGMMERMPLAEACGSDWLFVPVPDPLHQEAAINPSVGSGACSAGKIMLEELLEETGDQNFRALLIGDCTGNWQAPNAPLVRSGGRSARVRIGRAVVSGARVRVPVYVHSPAPYHALDLQLRYDPTRLTPGAAILRTANVGGLSHLHVTEPGVLRVAVASGAPIRRRSGALLVLEFGFAGGGRPATPVAVEASVDEQPAVVAGSAG